METLSDKTRAYLYSLLVHVGVFAAMFVGLLWMRDTPPVVLAGPVIEATFVGKPAAPRAQAVSKPTPPTPAAAPPPPPEPPKPAPTPPQPQAEVKPAPNVQHNDNIDQEKIVQQAEQKAEDAKRAQEEKHKREQILLDEQKKRDEAEAKTRQAEIQKQLEDVRKQQAALRKQVLAEQKKLQNLDLQQQQQSTTKAQRPPAADVPDAAEARTGMNGKDTGLAAEYSSALIKVVTDNWNRPDTTPSGVRCAITITQIPGGSVINTSIGSPCNADVVTQNSIKQAVTKAQPLPYKGYESVFQRTVTFIFKYDEN